MLENPSSSPTGPSRAPMFRCGQRHERDGGMSFTQYSMYLHFHSNHQSREERGGGGDDISALETTAASSRNIQRKDGQIPPLQLLHIPFPNPGWACGPGRQADCFLTPPPAPERQAKIAGQHGMGVDK